MPDSMTHAPLLFDRLRLRLHRARAAATLPAHDFLLRLMGERLVERLEDVTRKFPRALDLGAHAGGTAQMLHGRFGIGTLVQAEPCEAMLAGASGLRVAADEEWLPFADDSFDLVVSAGALHWVNDLPGALAQIRRVLKPDGLFLGVFPGGDSLRELRSAFEQAEMRLTGGVSPRVSPFVEIKSGGALLQRAGFALPVADSESLTVVYADPLALLRELRGMGETGALRESRKGLMPRGLLMEALTEYKQRFADADGRTPAHVELLTLTGWKPHQSQPVAARRGSGKINLGRALENHVPHMGEKLEDRLEHADDGVVNHLDDAEDEKGGV